MSKESNFKIIVPAEFSKAKDGNWRIRGLASTSSKDLQGEIIIQDGIDMTPVDEKRGILNFDHQKGPENIIGVIDGYKKTKQGLYIEGKLFKKHTKAKAVQEIMSSLGKADKSRIGLSVEGRILERTGKNGNIIKRCQIHAVAVTMSPINQDSYADLVKSMTSSELDFQAETTETIEENSDKEPTFTATQVTQLIEKALSVGSGYADKAPAELSGGEALAQEDLDSKVKKAEHCPKCGKKMDLCKCGMKKMSKDMYKSSIVEILSKLHELYPNQSRSAIWTAIKDRMHMRFPELSVNTDI